MAEVRRTLTVGAGIGLLLTTLTTMAAADPRPDAPPEVAQATDDFAQDVDVRRRAAGIDGVITGESACIEDALYLSYATELDDAVVLVDGTPTPGPVGTLPWPTVDHQPSAWAEVRVEAEGATYRLTVPLAETVVEACTSLGPTQVAEAFEADEGFEAFEVDEDAEVKGVVITSENGAGDADAAQVVDAPERAEASGDRVATDGAANDGAANDGAPDDRTGTTEARPSNEGAGGDTAESTREDDGAGDPDFASAVAAGAMSVTGTSASPLAIGAAAALLLSGGVALATGVRPGVRRRL